MLGLDMSGFLPRLPASSKLIHPCPRTVVGAGMINDWGGIVLPDPATVERLLHESQRFGFEKQRHRNSLQFRDPPANEVSTRILVLCLLDRRVDPHGVDPGDAALHLDLAVVNTWLVVREEPGEVVGWFLPVIPEMVGRE